MAADKATELRGTTVSLTMGSLDDQLLYGHARNRQRLHWLKKKIDLAFCATRIFFAPLDRLPREGTSSGTKIRRDDAAQEQGRSDLRSRRRDRLLRRAFPWDRKGQALSHGTPPGASRSLCQPNRLR